IYNGEEITNSIISIGDEIKLFQRYDKRHLLPFGEFIPEFFRKFGWYGLASGLVNFKTGNKTRTFKVSNTAQFDAAICYEIAFPGKIMDSHNSAWILNITNDSWFKDTDGPSQHLRITCFRAIEEGRAIARCANNGISAIIDCHGRIIKKLDTDKIGIIKYKMPLKYHETIYARYGNWIILFLIIVLLSVIIVSKFKKQNL
ncbi:MAG: apolipoprotein N-acyltransferase, partial [Holosporales bacterium]|nr:apolipoprotein N-acyltransferase [Holosporales bacterium]